MGEYGYAVFIRDPDAFIGRLTKALALKKYKYRNDLVNYYNRGRDNVGIDDLGSLFNLEVPFHKRSYFSYQQEYRVALLGAGSDGAVFLDIGDIRDIAVLMETKNVNSSLGPHFREKRG